MQFKQNMYLTILQLTLIAYMLNCVACLYIELQHTLCEILGSLIGAQKQSLLL